jgi:clan AA aspartic protease (TIGR02281 family)
MELFLFKRKRAMRRCLIVTLLFVACFVSTGTVCADEAVPFSERHGLKYVTVYLNEAPVELVFDTGATSIVLNGSGLLTAGIAEFDDTWKIQSHTAGGVTEGYIVRLKSVRIGNVRRNDYDATYLPSSTANLLGASFFAGYSYYIDEDRKVIRLVPKGSSLFDRPAEPEAGQRTTGSGLIEVEMDNEKYIYKGGRLIRKDQEPTESETSR